MTFLSEFKLWLKAILPLIHIAFIRPSLGGFFIAPSVLAR